MKLLSSLLLVALFTSVAHAEEGDAEDRALIEKSVAEPADTPRAERVSTPVQDKTPPRDARAAKAASSP